MKDARVLVTAAAVLTLGCVAEDPGPATPEDPTHPFVVVPGVLAVSAPVRIDGEQPAREPSIVQAPDGTLFVAGFWGAYRFQETLPGTLTNLVQAPLLWKSADDGATWERVDTGAHLQGVTGNSDLDLAVASDGVLYYATLTYLRDVGTTMAVGASGDGGATWTWQRIGDPPAIDRPWLRVDHADIAHLVWSGNDGVHHATSDDDGMTWSEGPSPHDEGTPGGFDVGPGGRLVVRLVPITGLGGTFYDGVDDVVVSDDGGATWTYRDLPGTRGWADPSGAGGDGTPRAWDPVAFDTEGTLFALWAEGSNVTLARSQDLGATWDTLVVADEGEGVPYYTFMRSGPGAGEVAATWFTNTTGMVAARVAHVVWPPGSAPTVRLGTFEADTGGDDHAEYFELTFLNDGAIAAPVPVTRDGGQWLEYRVAS